MMKDGRNEKQSVNIDNERKIYTYTPKSKTMVFLG